GQAHDRPHGDGQVALRFPALQLLPVGRPARVAEGALRAAVEYRLAALELLERLGEEAHGRRLVGDARGELLARRLARPRDEALLHRLLPSYASLRVARACRLRAEV